MSYISTFLLSFIVASNSTIHLLTFFLSISSHSILTSISLHRTLKIRLEFQSALQRNAKYSPNHIVNRYTTKLSVQIRAARIDQRNNQQVVIEYNTSKTEFFSYSFHQNCADDDGWSEIILLVVLVTFQPEYSVNIK